MGGLQRCFLKLHSARNIHFQIFRHVHFGIGLRRIKQVVSQAHDSSDDDFWIVTHFFVVLIILARYCLLGFIAMLSVKNNFTIYQSLSVTMWPRYLECSVICVLSLAYLKTDLVLISAYLYPVNLQTLYQIISGYHMLSRLLSRLLDFLIFRSIHGNDCEISSIR